MAKIADTYFKVDDWNIVEEGFNPEYAQVAESVFSQANEYMGTRGFFEEGYTSILRFLPLALKLNFQFLRYMACHIHWHHSQR